MNIKLLQSLIILILCRITTKFSHVSWGRNNISLFLLMLFLYREKRIWSWRVSQVVRFLLHQWSSHLTIHVHYLILERRVLASETANFDIIIAWNVTSVADLQDSMSISILNWLISITQVMLFGMLKMKNIASRRILLLLLGWCDMPFTGKLIDP